MKAKCSEMTPEEREAKKKYQRDTGIFGRGLMAANIVFSGVGPEGAEIGPIKIGCMHDEFELRCCICGSSVFSHMDGDTYACEGCGIQTHIFSHPEACRMLVEVQGA